MDNFKTRLTRAYQAVALCYAALRAPLSEATTVRRKVIRAAANPMLEKVIEDLDWMLAQPAIVLTLPAPSDDQCEDAFPTRRGENCDDLRRELAHTELRARCAALGGKR